MNVLNPSFKTEHVDNIVGTTFLDALILDSIYSNPETFIAVGLKWRLLLAPKR